MMRPRSTERTGTWLAVYALAMFWLVALAAYAPPNGPAAYTFLLAGLALTVVATLRTRAAAVSAVPSLARSTAVSAVSLLAWTAASLIAAVLLPTPYRIGAVIQLLACVLLLILRRRSNWATAAAALAGSILIAQTPVIAVYSRLVAHGHEAPWASVPVSLLLRAVGVQVSVDAGTIYLPMMRDVYGFVISWEMLGLMPALSLLAGGIVVLLFLRTRTSVWRQILKLVVVLGIYMVLRTAFMIVVYQTLHLYLDFYSDHNYIGIFWNTMITALSFLPAALLLERAIPIAPAIPARERPGRDPVAARTRRVTGAVIAAVIGVILLVGGLTLHEPGARKPGRVLVDEGHGDWERIDRPYDATWYGGDSGYNYYCIVDFLGRYFDVTKTAAALTRSRLDSVDVLILKIPTAPFSDEEVTAVTEFVREGGGLFLIGDHTNVFGSGYYLNMLARPLGFEFTFDCLFDIQRKFDFVFRPPRVAPHPVVRGLEDILLQTSCSIHPERANFEPIMLSGKLKSLQIDYASTNFYPPVEDGPHMRFGPFVQMVGSKVGKGRVVGFTDSTIFSNFAVFFPGRSELFLRTVDWLNRRNRWPMLGLVLSLSGILLVVAAWSIGGLHRAPGLRLGRLAGLLLAAGTLAVFATGQLAARAYPMPKPRRPVDRVVFDITHAPDYFATTAERTARGQDYTIFYQWVQRTGAFPSVRRGPEGTLGGSDLLVMIGPNTRFAPAEIRRVEQFVERGGSLLVIDGPKNRASTANELLEAFGLAFETERPAPFDALTNAEGVTLTSQEPFGGWSVRGGTAFVFSDEGKPLGAWKAHGRGSVSALGLAACFSDRFMGRNQAVVPNRELLERYQIEFDLIQSLLNGGKPVLTGVLPVQLGED